MERPFCLQVASTRSASTLTSAMRLSLWLVLTSGILPVLPGPSPSIQQSLAVPKTLALHLHFKIQELTLAYASLSFELMSRADITHILFSRIVKVINSFRLAFVCPNA
jgi:hypothetical protein